MNVSLFRTSLKFAVNYLKITILNQSTQYVLNKQIRVTAKFTIVDIFL